MNLSTLSTIRQGVYNSCRVTISSNMRRYSDDLFEYRHVQLPKNMLKKIPADYFDSAKGTLKLLWEDEWRALGITQVRGTQTIAQSTNMQLIPQFDRAWVGNITRFTNQSRIFFCSSMFPSYTTHTHMLTARIDGL
jgi:hypothetical protein